MPEFYHNHQKMAQTSVIIKVILIILITILLPFPLIILEKTILPYPALVEEITKALVIFFLILKLPSAKYKIAAGLLFGFLFGLSENIFYLTNFIANEELTIFWHRFLLTLPMHIITALIILFFGLWRKWLIIFGLAGAIILHTWFNSVTIFF